LWCFTQTIIQKHIVGVGAFLGAAAIGGVLVSIAVGMWARSPGAVRQTAARATAAALLVLAAGRAVWVERAYFVSDFVSERKVGTFPWPGGSVQEEDRGDWHMVAHTLPDGTRACGSGPDGPVVLFAGDSFMYGSGLKDEETLCWQLREQLGAAGLTVRAINLGQSGATLQSNVDTVAYGIETFHPNLVVLSTLAHDDERAFDLNSQREVSQTWWFRVGAVVLEPWSLWEALILIFETTPPDFFSELVAVHHLDRLGELSAATGTPVLVELVHRTPSVMQSPLARYAVLIAEADARHEGLVSLGFAPIPEGDPSNPNFIPGDGHTTGLGNRARAERLLPMVMERLVPQGSAGAEGVR
jgi:hypothetical protein